MTRIAVRRALLPMRAPPADHLHRLHPCRLIEVQGGDEAIMTTQVLVAVEQPGPFS
jgi:hypothetical protein